MPTLINTPKKRGAAPGENRGKGNQGRKPFKRKVKPATFRIYEDQLPISSKEVREAIDLRVSLMIELERLYEAAALKASEFEKSGSTMSEITSRTMADTYLQVFNFVKDWVPTEDDLKF